MPSVRAVYIPPPAFKSAEFNNQLRNALRRINYQVKKDLESTVVTWDEKPEFKETTTVRPKEPTWGASVTTDNEIYHWVNDGTGLEGPKHQKYPIYAGIYTGKSDKKALAFPSVFKPKTRPRRIASYAGMKGGKTVMRPYVMHPGIKARDFTGMIYRKRRPWMKQQIDGAVKTASRLSGHGM